MPLIMRAHELITIAASNKLKPSVRKVPDEAKVLRAISMKKMFKKKKSIMFIMLASMSKNCDIVKSKRMKIEYRPIVRRDKFSMY